MSGDSLLKKLKILSKIPEYGRIHVHANEAITLEPDSSFQGMARYIKGDNRSKSVNTIKSIVKQACELAAILMENKYMEIYLRKEEPIETAIQEHEKKVDLLNVLKKELRNAKRGIENLKETTYKEDASVVSELELVIYEVDSQIEDIEKKLFRVHDKYVNKSNSQNKEVILEENYDSENN